MIDENEMITIEFSAGDWTRMCDDIRRVTLYAAQGDHGCVDEPAKRELALHNMELFEFQSKVERQLRHHFFG